ncbi:MAG TPA: porin [Aquabacterium sp.]|nr:porin [Aquabacterium sp.]
MFAKKNLVAAAALMAIAGAAQADVKLYGYLDAGFGSIESAHAKGTSTRTTQVTSGGMMTSFIGFAGSEDLGSGMKAEFALESFIGNDTGATITNNAGYFWGRTSNVALSGGFGKVALGQYDNPLFTSAYTYNPFGSSMTLSPTMRHLNYIGQTAVTGAGVGFDTGWVNSITYETPVVQGFSGVLQYGAKESSAAGDKNSYAASGSYNNGPISATLTYVNAGKTSAPSATAYTANEKVTDLGASYDFGVVKAFGQYTHIKDDTNNNKDTIYQLGVSAPVNDKVNVMASFGSLKNKVNGASSSTTDRVFTVGADYALSKRTGVYGAFMNNTQTNLTSGQTALFGIKHTF